MSKNNTTGSLRVSQTGMVSIMVTMILMTVIGLIVIGFGTTARRNQRDSLDRQLSSQAFYAAETGVNDAVKALRNPAVVLDTADKSSCTKFVQDNSTLMNSTISASNNVSYPCVFVDSTPNKLVYTTVKNQQSTLVPISSDDAAPFTNLVIQWGAEGTTASTCPTSSSPTLPPASGTGAWTCEFAMLRFDIVPTTTISQTDLKDNARTFFVMPTKGAGVNMNISTWNNDTYRGQISYANCTGGVCTANVIITGTARVSSMALRLSGVYRNATNVTISGSTTVKPVALFSGAQAAIDVTGKAGDVLRRLRANVPIYGGADDDLPQYAVQSTDQVCKRFTVGPTLAATPSNYCL